MPSLLNEYFITNLGKNSESLSKKKEEDFRSQKLIQKLEWVVNYSYFSMIYFIIFIFYYYYYQS